MAKQTIISVIAAVGINRELGKNNKLLWDIPEDLIRFKELTTGHPVIMGRKTFASIGKLLPKRKNIIITRDPEFKVSGGIVVHSLASAIKTAENTGSEEIFIIGGGQVYEQALLLADKLYLTLVHKTFPEADTYFPDYSGFKTTVYRQEHASPDFKYTFLEMTK